MVGLEMHQVELDNYFKRYLEYFKNCDTLGIDELIAGTLEFGDPGGFRKLLKKFPKLTKKIQIQLIFTIKMLGLSVFSKELFGLVFKVEKKVQDPFLKNLILETIRDISDERYLLWLFPILKEENDIVVFIEMLQSIGKADESLLISIFKLFVSFKDRIGKQEIESFRKLFIELVESGGHEKFVCDLFTDSNTFKNLFLDSAISNDSLFNRIMEELIPVDKNSKKELLNILKTESHGVYPFILKNKLKFNFSDPVMSCIKSFTRETAERFTERYTEYLFEEKCADDYLMMFCTLIIDKDTHVIEDKLMEEVNEQIMKPSDQRDMSLVINHTKLLILKKRIIYTKFETKVFNILLPVFRKDPEVFCSYLKYLKRNLIKPSDRLLSVFFNMTDKRAITEFIDYYSFLLQKEVQVNEKIKQRIVQFINGAAMQLLDGESNEVIFGYHICCGDYKKATEMMHQVISSGDLQKQSAFLHVLHKLDAVEIAAEFKGILSEIVNNSSLSREVRSISSRVIIDMIGENEQELKNFIGSLNSLSITIFFESLIRESSRKTIVDVLTSFLDTEKLIVRNYIFNNLKCISDSKIEPSIIDKLIIPVFESNLFCFDVMVFLLNNESSLDDYRERLEKRFHEMKNPFNRLFLGLLLSKAFDYTSEIENFRSEFEESFVSEEQLEELYRLSFVTVFEKDFCNFFMKVHQKHIKLMVLRNMASNHIPEMFNQLLTSLRLESHFTLQKYMISIMSINFDKSQIRPLINIMNFKKAELIKEFFKLFLTYPLDFLYEFLSKEIEEVDRSGHDKKYVNKVKWVLDNIEAYH